MRCPECNSTDVRYEGGFTFVCHDCWCEIEEDPHDLPESESWQVGSYQLEAWDGEEE